MGLDEVVRVGEDETRRASHLTEPGFSPSDALHLACAESGRVDVFLTTDDKLMSRARRRASQLKLRVENPLLWLKEINP